MVDPLEIFDAARSRFEAAVSKGLTLSFQNGLPKSVYYLLASIAVPAQLMVEKDDLGSMMFQLHPNPEFASQKSWGWLCKVKTGYATTLFERGWQARNGVPLWMIHRDHCESSPGWKARAEAVLGYELIDLVAFNLDFTRCWGRLNSASPVIGWPIFPELVDHPVRVFHSPRSWALAHFEGAALVGDEYENIDWLQRCEHGIVTDDVKHGKAVQAQLRRPYDGPKILVAQ